MIAKMDAIEAPSKKQKLEEAASMNISMTADDAGQVGQLMAMMRNAGMEPQKVSDMPMSPRMDMEKQMKALGAMDDDPKIPGKDDVPGDQDLKAGALSTGVGSAAGSALTGGPVGGALGALAGGGGVGGAAGSALGNIAGNMIAPGIGGVVGSALGGAVGKSLSDDEAKEGDYANSPDEDYKPYTDVTNPPSNDINRSKKSYPKVAGGDNPMALASKIKEELSELYKEYKS